MSRESGLILLLQILNTVLTNYYSGRTLLRCPEIKKKNGASHETILKWNQKDLGQAPNTRLGICTIVRGPGPQPSGSHNATVPGGWLWHHKKEETSHHKTREDSKSGNMDLLELCTRLWIVIAIKIVTIRNPPWKLYYIENSSLLLTQPAQLNINVTCNLSAMTLTACLIIW